MDINNISEIISTVENTGIEGWKKSYFKKIRDSITVHTKGIFFSKVDTLFPNENPASKDHCKKTYEPITKSSIWKGLTNIIRVFYNSSFNANISSELSEYIEKNTFDGDNLFSFLLSFWVNNGLAADPNGMIAVYPLNNDNNIRFIKSEFIKYIGEDYIAFVSEDDSEIQYTIDDVVQKREVFYDEKIDGINSSSYTETTYNQKLGCRIIKEVVHIFSKDGIVIYKKTGLNEYEYEVIEFPVEQNSIPVFVCGGSEIEKGVYESFISPFIPFGNLALLQHRNHRAVDLMFSYPRMSELQSPCDHCVGGYVMSNDYEKYPSGKMPCSYCSGSGYLTIQSPYKVYQRKYDVDDAGNNNHLKVPSVEFYSPDVSILNYSKDEWKNYLTMAEQAIFVSQETVIGKIQSADSKRIDQEHMYAWLMNISKTFYSIVRKILQSLEDYISRNPIEVTIETPKSFAILTEAELFEEVNLILNSKAPVFVKSSQIDNFISKFVSKGSPIIKIISILKEVDLLMYYSVEDSQMFKSNNIITPEMWTIHILAYPVLVMLYNKDKSLFDRPQEEIIDELKKRLSEYTKKQTEDLRASIINFGNDL